MIERRAIAPHAVPDGADPVGVRELSADSAFASRQVLARDHSDRPHFRVQLPAQIRIVADGACRHGLHEMFSALDCGTIRRNGDRSRRHRVDLAEHALACHEHPNSHTRDRKTYPACHAEEPRSCHSSSLNLLPSFGSRGQPADVVVRNTLCSKAIQGFVARQDRPAATGIDQKANPEETIRPVAFAKA